VRAGFEQLDPGTDPGRRRFKTDIQRRLLMALVRADVESNDLPGAAQQARALARLQKETPAVGIETQRDEAMAHALTALALARVGAGDEARAEAALALAFERRLQAMESDDQVRHLGLSMALVASGAANPAQASVLLGEAHTSFDAMAAELRTSRTGRWIESLIVQEQRSLH
jgi:hypothetical protein